MRTTGCRERGFTLVEMLVVVAILFIAVMLSAPYLSKQIERSKIVGVANQVAGMMRLARMDAIKYSQTGCVQVQGDRVEAYGSSSDLCATRERELGRVQLPKSVTASATGFDAGVAIFRSDGSAKSPGSVLFAVPEMGGGVHCMQVLLAPAATARVQVQKKDITNTWGPAPWNWAPVGSCP